MTAQIRNIRHMQSTPHHTHLSLYVLVFACLIISIKTLNLIYTSHVLTITLDQNRLCLSQIAEPRKRFRSGFVFVLKS